MARLRREDIIKTLAFIGVIVYFFVVLKDMKSTQDFLGVNPLVVSSVPESDKKVKLACPIFFLNDGIADVIKSFNEGNKNKINIELIRVPKEKYDESLNLMVLSGETVDVFQLESEWIPSYIKKKMLLNLKSYLDDEFLSRFPEEVRKYDNSFSDDGKVYAVQSYVLTTRLIYNKQLFRRAGLDMEKPPANLKELREYANMITKACVGEGVYGFALPCGDEWSGFWLSMEIPSTYDGIYRYDFEKKCYDLRVYKPWLETYKSMKKDMSILPGEMSLKYQYALAQFSEGKIGMMFAPNWALAALQKNYYTGFSLGVSNPLSVNEGSKSQGKLMLIPEYYCINANTQCVQSSVEVWKYLNSEEFQSPLYKSALIMPVIPNLYANPLNMPESAEGKDFLRTKAETTYKLAPFTINERSRYKVYADIIQGLITSDEGLAIESNRLNRLMEYTNVTK